MRIVALLTVRNEELYLERCLRHLYEQGIETCLIDNESTDATRSIAEKFLGRGVFRIETLKYPGYFGLADILKNEERLAREIPADWFLHHDADEIREAPHPFKSLHEGFYEADRQGYNAINFDEFVFVPTSDHENFEYSDYVMQMKYYYYANPGPLLRVNGWKKLNIKQDLAGCAGHRIEFEGRRVFPRSFILRHYMSLSRNHMIRKYSTERVYSSDEVNRLGWFRERSRFDAGKLRFPQVRIMKRVTSDGRWDRSEPWQKPFFSDPLNRC